MHNSQLERRLADIERDLRRDDPALAQRFDLLGSKRRGHDLSVFALLALSAISFAVGVITMSAVAWIIGAGAYLMSFAVDTRFDRGRRRTDDHDRLDEVDPTDQPGGTS